MDLYDFVKPLGIATYALLLITFLTRKFKMKLKYHRFFAMLTILSATIHMLIVIFHK